jgi:flagellar protein FlgJ
MDNPIFDPSKLRIGTADKLNDTPVAIASQAVDGVDPAYRAKATQAAVKFESFFISHMLHDMRASTKELAADDSPYKDKVNDDMLDLADNLVADRMASQRAFGVADMILRQLLPAGQKVQPSNPAAEQPGENLAPPLNPPS